MTDLTTNEFTRRALIVCSLTLAIIFVLGLGWYGGHVLLLIFAAILIGIFLRGLSDGVAQHTPLSARWSLVSVVVTLLLLFLLGSWTFSTRLSAQTQELVQTLPQAWRAVQQRVEQYSFGQQLLSQVPNGQQASWPDNLFTYIGGVFSSTLSNLVNVIVVIVVGLYFAVAPDIYTSGIVRLVPKAKRERAAYVLHTLGVTLRRWLIGRFTVMTINGMITGIALWFLGIPLAFLLGVLTGLLNFIPNIGPILAAIPPVLLALMQGPTTALWVVVLYIVIQNLEGFVLTPLVQQRTVSLPPAVIILSQVLLGVFLGGMGVLLATPLAASILVLVKLLYVEDVLGDTVEIAGL